MLEFEPDFERRSCFVDKGQAELKNRRCLNPACTFHGRVGSGNIVRHGFYTTRSGKRRRYRCVRRGKTFSSTKGTPYYRLQHRRATFDAVVALRVEGVSISAVARIEGLAWNTVARWLEKAAGGKTRLTWIFVAIEVWSRLWPSTVVGRRSYRNTLALLRDVASRMDWERLPLIVTDGFDFYEKSVTESVASLVQRLCTARCSRREETIVS